MRRSAVMGAGVVVAAGAWLGCNAIIGLELPERDRCVDVTCVAADACREAGQCDPATGVCSSQPVPDGTACDDGNHCTQIDACQDGVCSGSPVLNGTACDDGNHCTQMDDCQAGNCTGSPVICPTAGGCQPGNCDPLVGCAAPDETSCNAGDACTQGADTCEAGICNPAANRTWAHWVPDTPKGYVVTANVAVDTTTRRTWQRAVPNESFTWQEAKDYCSNLSLPGYPSGWRLPTRIELVSIVDYTIPSPGPVIDTAAFPSTPSDPFWSSSLYAGGSSHAWVVHFYDGSVGYGLVDGTFRVRCVR